jgi:serine/threonine protein kinase
LVTTSLGRGTASYRAPEVLKHKSNSRTDIFGLGCIIFEIITTQRLFSGDWEVHEYAQKGNPIFPHRWPVATQGSRLYDLGQLTSTLLSAEPRERPGAAEALRQLLRLRTRSGSSEANAGPTSEDDFFDVENSDVDAPATTENPTIHSALRFLGETSTRRGGSLVVVMLHCVHANFSSCIASAREQGTTSQQPPARLPPQLAPAFSFLDQGLDSNPNPGLVTVPHAPTPNPFECPYRVNSGYAHGQSPGYPRLLQDVDRLRISLQSGIKVKARDTQTLIDILVPRTAYENDALRHNFRERCFADLGNLVSTTFSQAELPIKYALIGLAIGPALFDLWLLKNVFHSNI